MRPKPAFLGMLPVPWKTAQTKELAAVLARARMLEGREKDCGVSGIWFAGSALESQRLAPGSRAPTVGSDGIK
jgi:hypothetical protein